MEYHNQAKQTKIFDRALYKLNLLQSLESNNFFISQGQHPDTRLLDYTIDLCIGILNDLYQASSSSFLYGPRYINQALEKYLEHKNKKVAPKQAEINQIITSNIIKDGNLIVLDEETLPIKPKLFDLAISNLSLNFSNDFISVLSTYKETLKPKGLLIVNILGGTSLCNLRDALAYSDLSCYGGVHKRIFPMIQPMFITEKIKSCGFKSIIIEREEVIFRFQNIQAMLGALNYWGQVNCIANTSLPSSDTFWHNVEEYYENQINNHKSKLIWDKFEIITLLASL